MGCGHMLWHPCRSRGQAVQERVLSTLWVPRDWTQVVRPGGKASTFLCPLIFLTLSSFFQNLVLESFLYSPCLLRSHPPIRNLPCAADSVHFTSLASNRDVSEAYDFSDLCISVSLIIYEIRRLWSRWSLKSTLTFHQEVKHCWLGWSWAGLTTSSLG